MTPAIPDHCADPVWARANAFPKAPAGFGWVDFKGQTHPCDSFEALCAAIDTDLNAGVMLVWTPESEYMILPEEAPGAATAVLAARQRRTTADLLESQTRLRWFGSALVGLAIYLLYRGWFFAPVGATPTERLYFAVHAMLTSLVLGITLLMFLILAFIPWYQAHKRRRELAAWTAGHLTALTPTLRFETWLEWQAAPVTKILCGLLGVVAMAQVLCQIKTAGVGVALFHNWGGIAAAGLVKNSYLHGEWWRLFTAPLLHGNILHFLMNTSALLYLGKRLEVFARWPHLLLVFLFSASLGGEASARFVSATSVGASGGLMGWLGFLLVFEALHRRLVPRPASRRLLAGVVLTGIVGLIGFRFIDNAAHLGGLLAGMLYAIIVFPRSISPRRPIATITDRLAGVLALWILMFSALCAVWQILTA